MSGQLRLIIGWLPFCADHDEEDKEKYSGEIKEGDDNTEDDNEGT